MQLERKSPLVFLGSIVIHRRALSGIKAVYEQGYFTRYTAGKAKPEVQI